MKVTFVSSLLSDELDHLHSFELVTTVSLHFRVLLFFKGFLCVCMFDCIDNNLGILESVL